ncbi:hypothetical protein [Brevibacterium paucivorans]|uniref:hypothetical protein n=1 Tax=Brevibacterium paucivorans TaxID=170994 RepID=UPI0032199DE9
MRSPVPFVVPYVLFVASFIVEAVYSIFAVFGFVPRQSVGEGLHPVGVLTTLVSLALGLAALILLAWGKPVRQVISAVVLVIAYTITPLSFHLLNLHLLADGFPVVMMLSTFVGVLSFFLTMSAWVVADSHAPWMFAVALVVSIVNAVLSRVVLFVAGGAVAILHSSTGGQVFTVVLPLLFEILFFTGIVLVGRYMTAGAPNTDGGSGFSTSDRIGW